MRGQAHHERGLSAQIDPVSGMEQTASRTTAPPILLTQNRHPRRRWRGRFALLDPARSMPGAAPVFRRSGGDDGTSATNRRASSRAFVERRQARDRTDRGRTGGRARRAGTAASDRLTGAREWRREVSLPASAMFTGRTESEGIGAVSGGRGVRQDQRNGAIPCRSRAITYCLHIYFQEIADGATCLRIAPCLPERRGFPGFFVAPSACLQWRPENKARRAVRHG